MIDDSIGQKLKTLRCRCALSQAELAQTSGVPLPTIKDIERGATKHPHGKTLRALARALNVEPVFFASATNFLDR